MRNAALLSPRKLVIGRSMIDHRCIVGGMLWVADTGANLCDLPVELGFWQMSYSRYQCWRILGIWP